MPFGIIAYVKNRELWLQAIFWAKGAPARVSDFDKDPQSEWQIQIFE